MRAVTAAVAGLALLLAGAAPAAADDELIAQSADAVNARGDVVVWSTEMGERDHRLMARVGGVTQPLPVAASRQAFDPDLGAAPDGGVRAVYSRCSGFGKCDVYRYDFASGRERKVAGLARRRCDETAPSVWRDRIVLARAGRRCGGNGVYRYDLGTRKLKLLRKTSSAAATDIDGKRVIWAGDYFIRLLSADGRAKERTLYVEYPAEFEGVFVSSPSFADDGNLVYVWSSYVQDEKDDGAILRRRPSRWRCETSNRTYRYFEDGRQIQSAAFGGGELYYTERGTLLRASDPPLTWASC